MTWIIRLILFVLPSQCEILRLRLPQEVRDSREIDQESTFCTTMEIDYPIYVTKIEPWMSEDVNHIVLVAQEKGSNRKGKLEKCSNLYANVSNEFQDGFANKKIETIFAIGQNNNRQSLKLPSQVSFEIGNELKTLVLQVHFAPFTNYQMEMEPIGLNLHFTRVKTPFRAGILSLHANGIIKPLSDSILKSGCPLQQDIWPLAVMGHTHDLGRKIILRSNQVLQEVNPQTSQRFRPIEFAKALKNGDILYVKEMNIRPTYVKAKKIDCLIDLMKFVFSLSN